MSTRQHILSEEEMNELMTFTSIVCRLFNAAVDQAKRSPSPSGLYAASLVVTPDGKLALNAEGLPIVFTPPFGVAGIRADGTVELWHPDQHVRPGELADLASVDKATVYRAVASGELPEPSRPNQRTTLFKLVDAQKWMAGKKR